MPKVLFFLLFCILFLGCKYLCGLLQVSTRVRWYLGGSRGGSGGHTSGNFSFPSEQIYWLEELEESRTKGSFRQNHTWIQQLPPLLRCLPVRLRPGRRPELKVPVTCAGMKGDPAVCLARRGRRRRLKYLSVGAAWSADVRDSCPARHFCTPRSGCEVGGWGVGVAGCLGFGLDWCRRLSDSSAWHPTSAAHLQKQNKKMAAGQQPPLWVSFKAGTCFRRCGISSFHHYVSPCLLFERSCVSIAVIFFPQNLSQLKLRFAGASIKLCEAHKP